MTTKRNLKRAWLLPDMLPCRLVLKPFLILHTQHCSNWKSIRQDHSQDKSNLVTRIWWSGLTESCAHHFEAAHTLLRYSKLNITWTEFRADGHQSISISLGSDEVSAAIFARVHAIQVSVYLQWRKPNMHWPLSNSSTVNMHSCTPSLILSSKHSLPSGKSPHVYLP